MSSYYCVPGDRLCPADSARPGPGTYEKQGCIFASIAGSIKLNLSENELGAVSHNKNTSNNEKPIITVVREEHQLAVPTVGLLAYCKITHVSPRFVRCNMFAINNQPLKSICHGMIKREAIDSNNKDTVECSQKFRPDDIVIARIISLGDSNSYLLSTAEPELGVVAARTSTGETLVPVACCKMRCPKTNIIESRKVAKIQNDFIEETER
ncbi:unnamed protein product [Didymodactylos carnosus]|uniref:Exosome complex component N-terminal domain-containing protein n=1 Tax=Didymodactylos carnosus TaxID=1234261 RepID=A0A814APY1_9BILA|nr:unnamed protein product [Didymodactylos carnosus]CAF0975379.1 unnamed protein product [Didymodactylos carnosus]CAF3697789.1 unnamed protein product [Didymodactylos carnosus]CAF3746177.1 unnamed protein product [Didymodactylos carnosus]